MRRTVVTGMGLISSLGCGVANVWRKLLANQSGIVRLPDEFVGDLLQLSRDSFLIARPIRPGGFSAEVVVEAKTSRRWIASFSLLSPQQLKR